MEPLEPPREARQEKGKGKGKGKEGGAAAAAVHAAAAAAAASAASSNAEGRHLLQLLQAGSPGAAGKELGGLAGLFEGKGKGPPGAAGDDDEPRGAPRFDGKGEARGDESAKNLLNILKTGSTPTGKGGGVDAKGVNIMDLFPKQAKAKQKSASPPKPAEMDKATEALMAQAQAAQAQGAQPTGQGGAAQAQAAA